MSICGEWKMRKLKMFHVIDLYRELKILQEMKKTFTARKWTEKCFENRNSATAQPVNCLKKYFTRLCETDEMYLGRSQTIIRISLSGCSYWDSYMAALLARMFVLRFVHGRKKKSILYDSDRIPGSLGRMDASFDISTTWTPPHVDAVDEMKRKVKASSPHDS